MAVSKFKLNLKNIYVYLIVIISKITKQNSCVFLLMEGLNCDEKVNKNYICNSIKWKKDLLNGVKMNISNNFH